MNNQICQFHFNINQWYISTDRLLSDDLWVADISTWTQELEKHTPSLSFLPPLKRRRLSHSARLFVNTVWNLTTEQTNIPVVYASTNGEITRNFSLWNSLLKDGDLSPTSFSLSVHNALVGQWSELRQVTAETNAITAKSDNLEIALLEAYLLLQEGAEKVLVVVAESPLSEDYNPQPLYRQPFGYTLGLIIEAGKTYQLSLNSENLSTNSPFIDSCLLWVRQQYLSATQWRHPTHQGHWLWQKN